MCLPFYVNRPAWVQYSVNESGMWQPVFCFNHFSWFEIVCRLIPPSLTSIVSWEQTTRLHSFNIVLNAKWETLAQHTPYKDIQNAPALYTLFKWQVESGRALKRGDSTADIVMVWLNFNILTSKKSNTCSLITSIHWLRESAIFFCVDWKFNYFIQLWFHHERMYHFIGWRGIVYKWII